MRNTAGSGIGRCLAVDALSGAVGTAAMDLLLYGRYRRDGGKDSVFSWEFAENVTSWDMASAPGQLGEKVERLVTRRPPPDRWARRTTNIVHWATGVGWGLQYGALATMTSKRPLTRAVVLGPVVWLSGYVILPLAGVYKPIWQYDAHTLGKDLSAHMVYGAIASAAFAALMRSAQS